MGNLSRRACAERLETRKRGDMAKKKEEPLLENQGWFEDFVTDFVVEMIRLGYDAGDIGTYLARILSAIEGIKE